MMGTVLLGSTTYVEPPSGVSVVVNDAPVTPTSKQPVSEKVIVSVITPDFDVQDNPVPLDTQLGEVRTALGVWSLRAIWVEGHDDFFNQAVSQSLDIPVGRPSDWDAPLSPQEATSLLEPPKTTGALE